MKKRRKGNIMTIEKLQGSRKMRKIKRGINQQ